MAASVVRSCPRKALLIALGAALANAATSSAVRDAGACARIGLTVDVARSAYGRGVTLASLTEPGNAPPSLAHVPACFVSSHGTTVATVRRYPKSSWGELNRIYAETVPKPRRIGLGGLGPGASLFDVFVRAGHYEEDLLFRTPTAVVTVRSPVLAFPGPPSAPLESLAVLARGTRANLRRLA